MSIFTCDICKEEYNDKNKKPLSLPCGNIYCEECIKKLYNYQSKSFLCPNHKIYHQFKLSNIPICAQVYEHLKEHKQSFNFNNNNLNDNNNNRNDNLICCSRHQNQKINYFCKKENLFLCSICIKEHTDHNFISINIDKNKFKDEISELKEKIEEEKEKFFHAKFDHENYINKINNHIEEQIKKIREYFSSIIELFEIKKQDYINKFRNIQEKFQCNIEIFKNNINQISDLLIELTKKITYSKNELYPKYEYEKFYQEKLTIDSLLIKIQISEKNENFGFIYSQLESIPYYNIPKDTYNIIKKEENNFFGKITESSLFNSKINSKNNSKNNTINNPKNNTINDLIISEQIGKNKYLNMSPVDEKIIGEDEKTINNSMSNINITNSKNNLDYPTPSNFKDSLESNFYKKRENLNIFNQNLMSDINPFNKNKNNIKKKEKKNLKSDISYYSPEKHSKDTIISYSLSTNNITGTFKNDITTEKKEKIYKPQLIKNPLLKDINLKLKTKKEKEKEKISTSIRKYSFNTNLSITNMNTKPSNKNITTINTTDISNTNSTNIKFNTNRNVSRTSRNKRFQSNSPKANSMSNNPNENKKNFKLKHFNPLLNLNSSNNSNLKTKEIKRISSQIFKNRHKFKIKSNNRYKSPQDYLNNSSIFCIRRHSYNKDGDKTIG